MLTCGVVSPRSVGFTCDAARGTLDYSVYVMYPARELRSEYAVFREAIAAMLQPRDMQRNAYLVSACRALVSDGVAGVVSRG